MRLLKQSTNRNVMVLMVDSTDHITGKTGLTLTITASKDGGAFASITPTVTERVNGWYSLALTASHTDTLGDLALHVTGTGADPTDLVGQVVVDLPGATVASVTGSVGSVTGAVGSVTGAVGSVTGAVGSVTASVTVGTNNDKTGYALSAGGDVSVAAAVLARALAAKWGALTVEQALGVILSSQAAKTSGAGTGTFTIRDVADGTDVIVATTLAGNRTAVVVTP